jgi:hypothetical protein
LVLVNELVLMVVVVVVLLLLLLLLVAVAVAVVVVVVVVVVVRVVHTFCWRVCSFILAAFRSVQGQSASMFPHDSSSLLISVPPHTLPVALCQSTSHW